ncbi:MAG: toll/interleukin-1 receptor domain-containing protein [Terracidiphilus sp.]
MKPIDEMRIGMTMSKSSKDPLSAGAPQDGQQLRVFISYSHEDKALVHILADVIDKNGMESIYDDKKGLQVGTGFKDEIIHFISHAHIFLPLLTETSIKRPWVQQEIGYAVALRVPTVPVAINCEPGEFLHGIQAIQLKTLDEAELRKRLTPEALQICLQKRPLRGALYECAATTEQRAVLLAEYARAVTLTGNAGMVRQFGGLSSFHIPAETIDDPLWQLRYGNQHQSEHHRQVLWEERLALTDHAKAKGCRLIVDPDLTYEFYGGNSRRTRLMCLLRFIREMKGVPCEIAMSGHGMNESITIVGDWFAARSVSGKMGDGYRQTIFTRHAPTIARMIDEFDRRFMQTLHGLPTAKSRRYAIGEIERRIAELNIVAEKTADNKTQLSG